MRSNDAGRHLMKGKRRGTAGFGSKVGLPMNAREFDTLQIPVPDAIRRIANSEDRKLAWSFFVFFSRIEYALKRSGCYLMTGRDDAWPDWDKFASDHNDSFRPDSSAELRTAVEYFLEQPPRKQVRDGNRMAWSEPQKYNGKDPLLLWLTRMIRCVRNNLFHGGKFPLIPIADPSRDREILFNSLVILSALLPLDSRVERECFEHLN